MLFYAAPVFFVAMIFKLLFSVKLGWLPVAGAPAPVPSWRCRGSHPQTHIVIVDAILYGDSGYIVDVLRHAVLPALALGLLTGGVFLRLVRVNMLQTLRPDTSTLPVPAACRARVVTRRHAFRNALSPGGHGDGNADRTVARRCRADRDDVRMERSRTATRALPSARDFIAVQGIVTVIAIIVAVTSFFIDLAVALIDPRVRF